MRAYSAKLRARHLGHSGNEIRRKSYPLLLTVWWEERNRQVLWMVITEVTPAVAILTGSQHELTIKRVFHKVREHLKGTPEKRCALRGVGNRWAVRTSDSL